MLRLVAHTVNQGTRLPLNGASVSPSIGRVFATAAAGIPVSKNEIEKRRPPVGVL
ncbi:hypothetical protein HMPREF9374_2792 [Desmospora sp. 8437]|nr:hypothetical protein HMPREF9374_2792 [Desmospora sp. 8437]